jgi:hypothetical protein
MPTIFNFVRILIRIYLLLALGRVFPNRYNPPDSEPLSALARNTHTKTKLAAKIEKKNVKERKKAKKEGRRSRIGSGKEFNQAGAPFHAGELPSQFNAEQSELQRVGRTERRQEW